MAKLVLLFLESIVITIMLVDQGNAACCPCPGAGTDNKCADRTPCTPCCSRRTCNMFCCACTCRRLSNGLEDESSGFEGIDLDGNGFVDMVEAHAYLKSGQCGNYSEKINSLAQSFKLLDKDGNGKLTYAEIDTVV